MTDGQRRTRRRARRAEISQRALLKQASATFSTLALGIGCSGDDAAAAASGLPAEVA